MSKVKRVVHRLGRAEETGLDTQFWPVVVSLCVLTSFILGAVLTIVQGPMLWLSLMVLPAGLAAAIIVLAKVNHRRVRRGLQLALIISLILHIGILITAHRVVVFGSWSDQKVARSPARVPQRTIRLPSETPAQPWEQINVTETPEIEQPEVEREAVQPEPETERPQPTPVEEPEPTVQPQQAERKEASQTSPRFSEQSSKLSRNQQDQRAQTSTQVADAAAAQANRSTTETSSSSPSESRVAKQSSTQRSEQRETQTSSAQAEVARQSQPTRAERSSESPATPQLAENRPNRATPLPATRATVDTQAALSSPTATQQPTRQETQTSTTEIAATTPLPRRQSATPTPVQRQSETEVELTQPNAPTVAQSNQARAVRRERASELPTDSNAQSSSTAVASRSEASAATPTTVASAEAPSNSQSAQATEIAARSPTAVRREQSQPTQSSRPSAEPETRSAIAQNSQPRRNEMATVEPRASAASRTVQAERPTNRPRSTIEPTTAAQTSSATVAQTTAPQRATEVNPQSSSSNVARQPQRNNQATRNQIAQPQPTTALTQQTPQRVANANPNSTSPAVDTNQQSPTRRRTLETGDVAASPRMAESPTTTPQSNGERTTAAAPERFAVSRASQGVTGAGESRNLDRDIAAGERPAITASNSMRRAESTTQEPGQTLQPSQPSQRHQSIAGQFTPSSSVAANTNDGTAIPAAAEATGVAAQASATQLDSRSPSEVADVSALRGSSEIDLGPPKIVANELSGRGAGGGQPEPSSEQSNEAAEQAERGTLGAAIAANLSADVPVSPREEGDGDPLATPESPSANSLARSEAGGEAALSGGPTSARMEGPSDLSSSAPDVGAVELARAESGDAIPSEPLEGGGFENDEDEDEEERERRRRLAQAGGGQVGPITSQRQIELPSAEATTEGIASNANAANVAASDTGTARERSGRSGPSTGRATEAVASGSVQVGQSQAARREVSDGVPGPAAAGGGTDSRRRNAPPVSIAGSLAAESVTGEALAVDDGGPSTGVEATATEASRLSGSRSDIARASVGIVASQLTGPTIVALPPVILEGEPGGSANPARGSDAGETAGPQPRRGRDRGERTGPATSLTVDGEIAGDPDASAGPQAAGGSPSTNASTNTGATDIAAAVDADSNGPSGNARLRRARQGGSTQVLSSADDGPGGLGDRVTPQVGLNDRRARQDQGPVQAIADSRFIRDNPGGKPSFNPTASMPAEAFAGRTPRRGGGSPQTEEAIELGLAFLARHQQPEGHWILETFGNGTGEDDDETPVYRSDGAATGLALLAFQGAGYNHLNYKYAAQLQRAVRWMVENQDDDGCLYTSGDEESNRYCRLYSHAIATLALCEAYGMTQDPNLREPVQKALNYIVANQDSSRGGWRYTPGRSTDTSVTGWMMMALKSGQLAGLDVPRVTYQGIEGWLDVAQVRGEPHKYVYNPYAANTAQQQHGREASRSMTAVGLLMRLYFGWNREQPVMRNGADYLLERLPSHESSTERDTYYWYYATQVLRHVGGEQWEQWNSQLHPLLINSQIREPEQLTITNAEGRRERVEDNSLVGSWSPLEPVPDAWGLAGGRIYVTALNLLSLEVDYRLLPLYQDTVE